VEVNRDMKKKPCLKIQDYARINYLKKMEKKLVRSVENFLQKELQGPQKFRGNGEFSGVEES